MMNKDKIEKTSNYLIIGALIFLALCCVIWLTGSQYNLAIIDPPTINKLAVIAVGILALGTLTSKFYVKKPDKNTSVIRKFSFLALVLVLLGFIGFVIFIVIWALTLSNLGS